MVDHPLHGLIPSLAYVCVPPPITCVAPQCHHHNNNTLNFAHNQLHLLSSLPAPFATHNAKECTTEQPFTSPSFECVTNTHATHSFRSSPCRALFYRTIHTISSINGSCCDCSAVMQLQKKCIPCVRPLDQMQSSHPANALLAPSQRQALIVPTASGH